MELTSGNTGTGLAIVCGVRGHPFVAVMSEGNSAERATDDAALWARRSSWSAGSRAVEQPGKCTWRGPGAASEDRAQELTASDGASGRDQFVNRVRTARAHERHTGPELWQQGDGRIDAFVRFVGTGRTDVGVAVALKDRDRGVKGYVRGARPVRRR